MKRGYEKGIAEVNGHIVPTSREYVEEYDPNSYGFNTVKRYVGEVTVYEDDYEEEEPINYCKKCLDRGYQVVLGPKILMNNEPRPDDYEEWLQCPTCYEVIPIHEIPAQEEIKDTIETQESPFDNKFHLETFAKRNSPAGKRASAKKRKKIQTTDDKDILREIKNVGERNVKIHYDSNP
jgi:hypothetical protein